MLSQPTNLIWCWGYWCLIFSSCQNSSWAALYVVQLDLFNRTLMQFSDRESDFGPLVSSHGVWVTSNCIHWSTALAWAFCKWHLVVISRQSTYLWIMRIPFENIIQI